MDCILFVCVLSFGKYVFFNVDFRPSFMIEIGNYVCFHHRGKNLGIKLPIPRWKIYIISYILIDMWSEIKC